MLMRSHGSQISSAVTHWTARTSNASSITPHLRWILYGTHIAYGRTRRRFTTSPVVLAERKAQQPDGIAVLGGGITGLTTAYLLADTFPNRHITLIESKDTLGGWVCSKEVDVGNGEILFEQGPRSLRPAPPNGTLALRIIQDLDLTSDLLITPKSSPAARNRFVYYPDHLVRMPGPRQPGESLFGSLWRNILAIWSEPVFAKMFSSIVNEPSVETRPRSKEDESVGDFIARRFNKAIANNIASALFHGIYAGDVWKMSVRSILGGAWKMEMKFGSVIKSAAAGMRGQIWGFCDDVTLQTVLQEVEWDDKIKAGMTDCSVFTFKHGLGTLTEALVDRLEQQKNVSILRKATIKDIERLGNGDLKITHTEPNSSSTAQQSTTYTHAVATIPPRALIPLLRSPSSSQIDSLQQSLGAIPAVTVMVINLYYSTPKLLQTITPPGGFPRVDVLSGFGYLIPNSVPFNQNPERALGVIFDSDITPDLWTSVPEDEQGTKLTVMMGGHWWDGWSEYPTSEEGELMAKAVLARHLGITEEPKVCQANLQQDCIPQYHVGHTARMRRGHEALVDTYGDRLRVAGSWYHGVGVNDCLRVAFDTAAGLASDIGGEDQGWNGLARAVRSASTGREKRHDRGSRTGLQGAKSGRPMVLTRRHRAGEVELLEIEKEGRDMGYFPNVKVSGQEEKKEEEDDN